MIASQRQPTESAGRKEKAPFSALALLVGFAPPALVWIVFTLARSLGLLTIDLEARTLATVAALFAAAGAFLLYGVHKDRKARREVAAASSIRYRALSEAAGVLVMHHDGDGQVLTASEDALRLFEVASTELLGGGFFNRLHVLDRPAYLQAISQATYREEATTTVVRLRCDGAIAGGGEPRFAWAEVRVRKLPVLDSGEGAADATALVSITRNVTELKDIEQRLEIARAEAGIAVSMKDRLLANVSHELRTPLNAILGFSEILGNPELAPTEPARITEYANIIHSSAEHLLSVVNLVLDTSRIEAGKFEILPEPFELEPLLKDCCDMLRLKAEAGRISLSQTPPTGVGELVADKRACRQILLNLMANAVKFTPPDGRVVVGADADGASIRITVADTGIGIAAKDLPRLGDPFYQVRSSYDRSFEGAGLGLSLVRGLVGLHGGTLLLESEPGIGTRVTVILPRDCRDIKPASVGAPRLETFATLRGPGATPQSLPGQEKKIA